ncbi:MAG: LysM peptidoglycan-binding domain-containing protein, partial [Actinomycetaceae bacterium]|nr:LysM peptidoglycan-binding domain-containing protein [Actinomycetaceae bacterium]
PMKEEMPSQTPPPQTSPSIHSIHSTPPNNIYTVKSGDTLWDIAKAHLPPNSPDNAVAQACLIWHVANPALANPNLIFPKQTLTIPQEYLS